MPFLSFDLQTSQETEEVSSYVPVAAYALLTLVSGWRLWVHRARGCSFAAWTSAKFAFHGYLFAFAVFRTVANVMQLMPDFSGLPALIFNSISGCSYISLLLFLEMHWRDLLRPLAAVRRDRQAYLLSYAAFAFANLGLYAFIGVCVWLEWTERSAQEMEGSSSPPPLYWSQGVIDGLLILIAISYTSTAVRMWLRVGATLKAAGKSASKASVMEGSTGSDEESYSELYHSLLPSHAETASTTEGTKSVQQGAAATASASASASSRAVLASLQAFIGIMLSSACLLCVRAAVSLSTSGAVQGQWWWQLAVTWLPDVPPCLAYMVLMWPRDGDKTLVEGSRSRLGQLFRQLVVLGEPALGAYSGTGSQVSPQNALGANTPHVAGSSGPMSPLTLSIRTPGRSTGGVGTPLLQHDHLSHSNTGGLGMLLPESAAGSQAAHERLQAAASATVVHCTEVAPLPAAAAISIIAAPLLSLSFAHVLLPSRPALVREQAVPASSRPSPPNGAPTAAGASSTYPPGGRGPVHAGPGRGMGPRRHTVRQVGAGLRLASHDDDNKHHTAQQDRTADSPQSTPRMVAMRSSSIGEYEPTSDRSLRLPASPIPTSGPGATPMSAQSAPLQPVRTPGPTSATAGIRTGWYTAGAGARAGALPASAGGSTQAPGSAVSGWSRADVGETPSYSRFAVQNSFMSPRPSGGMPGAAGPGSGGQPQHPILLSLPPALVHARLSELRTWLGWECYAVVQVGVAPVPPQTPGSGHDSSTSPTLLPYRLPQSVVGLAQAHARAQGVGIATGQAWLQAWQSVCGAQASSPSELQLSSPSLWRYLGHSEPSFLQEEDEGGSSSGSRGDIDVGYGGSKVSGGVWLSANTDEEPTGSALRSGPSMSATTLVGQPCISTRASFGLGLLCPLPALVEAWEGARAINRAMDAQSSKANADTGNESSDDSAPPSPFAASTESERSPQATAPAKQPPSIAPAPGQARYGAFLRVSLRWYDSADEEGQGSVGSGIGADSVGHGEEEISGVRTWGMVQANPSLGNLANAPTSPPRVRGGSGGGRMTGQDGTRARASTAAGASPLLGYTGHADSGQEYCIGNWDLPISTLLPLLLSRVDSGAPGAGAAASEIIIPQSDAPQHVAQAPLPPGPSTMASTIGSTSSGAATLGNAVMIINGSGLSSSGGMSVRAGGGFASPMYSLAGPSSALSTIGEGTHSFSRPGLLRLCCEPLTSVRPGLDLLLPPPWAWPQLSEAAKGKKGSKSKVKALALDDDDEDDDRTPNDLFDEEDDDGDDDEDDVQEQENARAGAEHAEDENSGEHRTHADTTSSNTEIEAQTVDDNDLADDESSKDRQQVGQVAVHMQAVSGAGSGTAAASETQRMGHQNSGRRMKRVGTAVVLAKKLAEAGQRYLQLGPSAGSDAAVAGDAQSVAQSASSAVAQPDVRKRNDKSGVVKHGKEREVAPLGLAHDGYGRAGIRRLPHSSRRLDHAVYGYTLSLRAVLPSGGSAGPQAAVLPASPAPSMPLLPGSAGSKASTTFTSPAGVARSVAGGGTPASAFARTGGMSSTALLPLPLPPASAYGRLLPRLCSSSGAPLELRISAVECTIESHASVSVPRAVLPLVLASRTTQLGRARAMLERYLFAMRKGRGNESTRQSQGSGSDLRHSGLSGIYSRLVSHIEREEEAMAGARWLTHRLVRLQAGVGDLQAVLREVCGFHCAATLGPGMGARGRSRSALIVPAAGRSASFISGQPQLQALASAGILDAGRTLLHAQLLSAPVPRSIAPAPRKGRAPGIGPVKRGKAGSRAWSTESIQGATTDVPPVSTFRPSTRKKDSTARYMAVNLHAQMMTMQSTLAQVWEPGKQERATGQESEGARPAYPVATATVRMVTVGAPCSHWHGFRGAQGLGFGLARLLASQGPPAATLDGQTNFAAPHKVLRELAQNQRLRECEDARLALRARAEACYSQALSGLTASFTQSLQAALDQCSTTTASAWLAHMQNEASKAPNGAVPSVQRAAIGGWLRLQQETSCDGYRALRQWLSVGWPAVWQSLLSAVGKERGMLDDARVSIAACSLLRFALVDADEAGILASDSDRAAAQGAGADEWLGAEHGGTGLPASACAEPAAGPVPMYAWQTGSSAEGEETDGRGLQAGDCTSVVPLQVLSHAVQALPAWLWSQVEASMGSIGGIIGSNGEGTPEGLVLVIPVTGLRAACIAGVVPPDLIPHGAGPMSTHSPYPTMAACPAFLSCGINEQAQVASLLGTHGLQADVNACSVRALWAYVRAWVAHVNSENARLRRQAESVQQLLAVGRQAGADSAPFASNDLFATHVGLGSALTRGHGDHLGRLWVETCANIDEAASQRSSGLGGFAGAGASFREMSASFLSRGGKDGDSKKLRSMASAGPRTRVGQSFGHPISAYKSPGGHMTHGANRSGNSTTSTPVPTAWAKRASAPAGTGPVMTGASGSRLFDWLWLPTPPLAAVDDGAEDGTSTPWTSSQPYFSAPGWSGGPVVPGAGSILPATLANDHGLPAGVRWIAASKAACSTPHVRQHGQADASKQDSSASGSLLLPAPPSLVSCLPTATDTTAAAGGFGASWAMGVGEDAYSDSLGDGPRARLAISLLLQLRSALMEGYGDERDGMGDAAEAEARGGYSYGQSHASTATGVYAAASGADMAPFPELEGGIDGDAGQFNGGATGESASATALRLADDLCFLMRGGKIVSCKSAKDRTGMEATLSQARRLAAFEAGCLASVATALSTAPAVATAHLAWLQNKDANHSDVSLPFQQRWLLCAPAHDLSRRWATCLSRIRSVWPIGHGAAAALPELVSALVPVSRSLPAGVLAAGDCLADSARAHLHSQHDSSSDSEAARRASLAAVSSLGGTSGGLAVGIEGTEDACLADPIGTASFLREYGTRLACCAKNTGSYRYAFSGLQRAFFPPEYRAPNSTIGGNLT